jgi:hypothetical protein
MCSLWKHFGRIAAILCLLAASAVADGPADNQPDNVRRVPKLGVEVSDTDRQELTAGLDALAAQIAALRAKNAPFLADVQIFHRAVEQALKHQEFFDVKEIPVAKRLLQIGRERAEQLLAGEAPWTKQTGLVVLGYRSKIDHTVQPYGLVIPETYQPDPKHPVRCDLWFHGRGEMLSEVSFLSQRMANKGEFTPPNTIVLHPYGRYCNANKFAGEIDTFEALADAQKRYAINPERIAVRGFSMGGAACWQFAVHYPGKWFAANPGAGFSETPDFLKVFQSEDLQPTWYEQKLWRMYDCTGYAANLAFLPTVAYSGEVDKQKQAADMMAAALKTEGLPLLHIIGPMTGHKIHPDSKVEIERYLSRWDRLGAPQALASPLAKDDGWETIEQFQTYTLRYNQSRWITIMGLEEHWEPARVVVQRRRTPTHDTLRIVTQNVDRFVLNLPLEQPTSIAFLDGLPPRRGGDAEVFIESRQYNVFQKDADGWRVNRPRNSLDGHRKVHGLQGPIDDAFLDSFLFVKPTRKGVSEAVDHWVMAEFDHAVTHWRQQMRGDARVKLDTEITLADMRDANVVFWGDPSSNDALFQLFERLPITWKMAEGQLAVGDQRFDMTTHVPLLIYPNPLNPQRYLVLNSSFTYREYDYLNNARQTPKLPDWAIVDVRTPPNSRWPGKIVAADFFNEQWELKPPRP